MTHPPAPRPLHPRRTRRRAGVLAALCAVLVALLGVTAPAAWAHTELDSSDPADSGTVDRPPTSVRLVFAEQVRGADPVLTITVAGFDPVEAPAVIENAIVTADLTAVDIPGLAAATYPVAWEVGYRLVALDGDDFSGRIDFTVTAPPETAPASTEAPPATSPAAETSPAAASSTAASTASSPAADTSVATSPASSESSAAGPGTTTSTSEGSAAAPGTTDAPTADSSSVAAADTAGSGGSGWWWAAAVVIVVLVAGGAYWFVRSRRAGTSTT